MNEVSSTRLYLGNLPRNVIPHLINFYLKINDDMVDFQIVTATKADVEAHFNSHGTGEITEIKLMNGFGFIEYKDALDARDVVPAFHGSEFMGERLTVQFARGSRSREAYANTERTAPRPRRTPHRMQISGLPGETSWQVRPSFPFFALEFWISLSLLDDQHHNWTPLLC
ncbi:Pre-mRNA-splicing factor srp2 [Erysiphe neolycopersici]|uniref:Pre-mRNA-splicing factor srp2 n=1 Tax=Erysiphe neolycopersici TaxID=212602 RepID=A0A420HZR3_9PEZI|nr:Pre-mRNA-splicing factor srp2 [Erysiphe neolycopersici]